MTEKELLLLMGNQGIKTMGLVYAEDIIEKLAPLVVEKKFLEISCKDWAELDTAVRNFAYKFLSKEEVDGTSYGVPPAEELIERIAPLVMKIPSRESVAKAIYTSTGISLSWENLADCYKILYFEQADAILALGAT